MKKRPFYNIAHHCNTEREVNENIEIQGANAIECDITPLLHNGVIKLQVSHTWDFFKARLISQYTDFKKIDSYFQNLKRFIDNKRGVAMLMKNFGHPVPKIHSPNATEISCDSSGVRHALAHSGRRAVASTMTLRRDAFPASPVNARLSQALQLRIASAMLSLSHRQILLPVQL